MMAVILGCVWIIAANVLALIPSRDNHWARAYGLIGVGIPLLIYIGATNGVWVALAFLVGGASVLRWPVVYLARWARGFMGGVMGGFVGSRGKDQGPE